MSLPTHGPKNRINFLNVVPVFSQMKSGLQYVCGDADGAMETLDDFKTFNPIANTVMIRFFDDKAESKSRASRSNEAWSEFIEGVVDGIPVFGHMKGWWHVLDGEEERGARAVASATRSVTVIAAGIGGGIFGGPAGACAAGVASGAAFDSIATAIESGFQASCTPSGTVALATTAANAAADGDVGFVGKACDLVFFVTIDAVAVNTSNPNLNCQVGQAVGTLTLRRTAMCIATRRQRKRVEAIAAAEASSC
eukprot:TRINITY_DN10362_c0_g1_i2.p1 TRINITY_DN10362_c0_g1~~TRINITY_DN10362_c0_g1_i2.p1  ORF type:complete len:252 (+),score=33.30 TRINITY_DN10362_c0_g1_i2:127-882(+)